MDRKIIYIIAAPYNEKSYYDFYYEISFLNEGYDIEIWSICDYLSYNVNLKQEFPFVKYFKDDKEVLINFNKQSKKIICFLQIPINYKNKRIFNIVVKVATKVAKIDYVGSLIDFNSHFKSSDPIPLKNREFNIFKFINKIKNKFFIENFKRNIEPKIDFFKVGQYAKADYLSINNHDYEIYLQNNSSVKDRYIVFIDIALTHHPDLLSNNIKCIDSETYLYQLNYLFDKLEQEYNKEVIICAHPRSSYDANAFKGRKIILNQTNEYVRDAYLTIMHVSSAFAFSLLYKKPMLFISSNDIQVKLPSIHNFTINYANYFNSPYLDLDNIPSKMQNIINVNPKLYDNFIEKYLKSTSKNQILNKDKFKNYLEN